MGIVLAKYDPKVTGGLEKHLLGLPYETKFSDNALRVLETRYLKKDEAGLVIETPKDMLARTAAYVAFADSIYMRGFKRRSFTNKVKALVSMAEQFYTAMINLDFLPNSPTLRGAGRGANLAACYVLPVRDSRKSIFRETLSDAVDIQSFGGGTGFNFSELRPKGDIIRTSKGESSGPISFMEIYSFALGKKIAQGGTRQGANMGILNYNHPDIEAFIAAKKDNDILSSFNISVGVTEEFMRMVEAEEEYELINPRNRQVVRRVKALKIFDKIVHNAWLTGDPGIVYLDRIDADNPTPHIGKIVSTNPCGEQPLLPYESCNLGSINLANFVVEKDGRAEIDYKRLGDVVDLGVHTLDNIIDMNNFPVERVIKHTKGNRKIGLGVMGWADVLFELGLKYDSKEAVTKAEEVMGFVTKRAKKKSVKLAEERGVFPNFEGSVYDTGKKSDRVRNATRTTIAPTGTLSTLASCSSGIEPIFGVTYTRRSIYKEDGSTELELTEVNPSFEKVARERKFYDNDLAQKILENDGLHGLEEVPQDVKELFVTAHDISSEWHSKMQDAFQKNIDNAVSKTVNFPESATVEDVREVFLLSYGLDVKGVTIYRDKSKTGQVLTTRKIELEKRLGKEPTPKRTSGERERKKSGCGWVYTQLYRSPVTGEFIEVFNQLGKAGGCPAAFLEALSREISLALKYGVPIEEIVEELVGISCHRPFGFGASKINSCIDAVGRSLEDLAGLEAERGEEIRDGKAERKAESGNMVNIGINNYLAGACPECGGPLEVTEGCRGGKCVTCGYSACD